MIEPVKAGLSFQSRHSTAADVGRAAEAAGLKNLILTHISPRFAPEPSGSGLSIADVEAEARAHYSGRLFLAQDLDQFTLDRAGQLERQSSSE